MFALLMPLFGCLLFHGWLLVTGPVAPLPEHPIIAREEAFYRATDPWGYLDYSRVTRMYHIAVEAPDRSSPWFQGLPNFVQESGMFVWDTPTVWINHWDQDEVDPGMTMSTIWHELVHVLGRWHPDYLVRTEGLPAPLVDMNDWRTWAEEEAYASNIQYRVAKRLNTPAGVQYAKDLTHLFLCGFMTPERRQVFLAVYGKWLEPELQAQSC